VKRELFTDHLHAFSGKKAVDFFKRYMT